jgi:hypothetical protein
MPHLAQFSIILDGFYPFVNRKVVLMKKILSVISIAVLITACKNNSQPSNSADSLTMKEVNPNDTAGLAKFQQWKAQHELTDPSKYNPDSAAKMSTTYTTTTVTTTQTVAPVGSTAENHRTTHRSSRSHSAYSGSSMSSQSAHTAKATKKGWSKGAKGAVIGGASGAVLGAVLDKKHRAAGGVIGGVVGAAAGYGIGHAKDKKDGRN